MITPSPIERHMDIVRAFGTRTKPLDQAVGRRARRRARNDDRVRVPITLREAVAQDRPALARLAQLDGRRLPAGPQVVAVADGRILAAAEVRSGRAISDPFRPTAAVLGLLRLRAEQLRRELSATRARGSARRP